MVRIIVKGNAEQTRAALDARGIGTTRALLPGTRYGYTIAWVHITDLDAIVAWFVEQIPAVKGEGFPPGTLLHYHDTGVRQ